MGGIYHVYIYFVAWVYIEKPLFYKANSESSVSLVQSLTKPSTIIIGASNGALLVNFFFENLDPSNRSIYLGIPSENSQKGNTIFLVISSFPPLP